MGSDLKHSHIMLSIRAMSHSSTRETPNFSILSKELWLPGRLLSGQGEPEHEYGKNYALQQSRTMQMAHDKLTDHQSRLQTHDNEEPPLFHMGGKVWLRSKRTSKKASFKLSPKGIGPLDILQVVEQNGV